MQTCFLFTLRAIAQASRVDFISLDLDAAGTVDRQDGVTRFTEKIAARIQLTAAVLRRARAHPRYGSRAPERVPLPD